MLPTFYLRSAGCVRCIVFSLSVYDTDFLKSRGLYFVLGIRIYRYVSMTTEDFSFFCFLSQNDVQFISERHDRDWPNI